VKAFHTLKDRAVWSKVGQEPADETGLKLGQTRLLDSGFWGRKRECKYSIRPQTTKAAE